MIFVSNTLPPVAQVFFHGAGNSTFRSYCLQCVTVCHYVNNCQYCRYLYYYFVRFQHKNPICTYHFKLSVLTKSSCVCKAQQKPALGLALLWVLRDSQCVRTVLPRLRKKFEYGFEYPVVSSFAHFIQCIPIKKILFVFCLWQCLPQLTYLKLFMILVSCCSFFCRHSSCFYLLPNRFSLFLLL